MTVIPGQITLELLIGNPLIYMGILFAGSIIGGILRGSMESDAARAGDSLYKGMENLTIYDWLKDAGNGLLGGFIFLAIIQVIPMPDVLMPVFGYAGRKMLIKWGSKAEAMSDEALPSILLNKTEPMLKEPEINKTLLVEKLPVVEDKLK